MSLFPDPQGALGFPQPLSKERERLAVRFQPVSVSCLCALFPYRRPFLPGERLVIFGGLDDLPDFGLSAFSQERVKSHHPAESTTVAYTSSVDLLRIRIIRFIRRGRFVHARLQDLRSAFHHVFIRHQELNLWNRRPSVYSWSPRKVSFSLKKTCKPADVFCCDHKRIISCSLSALELELLAA